MSQQSFKKEVKQIIDAAEEVHRQMGNTFTEEVYLEALAIEFKSREIPHEAGTKLRIYYKEHPLNHEFTVHFLCYEQIIVVIKVIPKLSAHENAEVIHCMKATKKPMGLLINFGTGGKMERRKLELAAHSNS